MRLFFSSNARQSCKRRQLALAAVIVAAIVTGCARSSTQVLEPYTLADGRAYQDVVTVAADERGAAPVVTHVKTFRLGGNSMKDGGAVSACSPCSAPVADASGSSPGMLTAAVQAASGAATGAAMGIAMARTKQKSTVEHYFPDLGAAAASDWRLKRNVQIVGTARNGLRLYSFQYVQAFDPSGTFYVGVMAQDILRTHPNAVVTHASGYYFVRYDLLGLRMITLDEWNTKGRHAVLAAIPRHQPVAATLP